MMQYTAEPLSQVMKGATKQSIKKKTASPVALSNCFFLFSLDECSTLNFETMDVTACGILNFLLGI